MVVKEGHHQFRDSHTSCACLVPPLVWAGPRRSSALGALNLALGWDSDAEIQAISESLDVSQSTRSPRRVWASWKSCVAQTLKLHTDVFHTLRHLKWH